MFSKKAFRFVMPFWIALIIVVIMCCVMSQVKTGGIPFPGILRNIAIGTAVAYAVSVLLPVSRWAEWFAMLFRVKQGSIVYVLLSNVIPTIIFGILMTLLFTYLAIGLPPYFVAACIGDLPLGLGVGYLAGLVAMPISLKLAAAMCTKD